MTRFHVTTPSRLHFGLLGWGPEAPRQFGGAGLMIDHPALEFAAEPAPSWRADGPLGIRVIQVAGRVAEGLARRGVTVPPARFEVLQTPPQHSGLGVGTQLSLAVARIVCAMAGLDELPIEDLAELSGRGLRSGIGLHGSVHGGLIVDGGRRASGGIPPLLFHRPFPEEWAVLVVVPGPFQGLHGPAEIEAFAGLPPMPQDVTDRLCHLVLLGLLPAVVERDLPAFGDAVARIQRLVGRHFAPAQGGVYARPAVESLVKFLEAEGLHGVGQSSWGPAVYAFSADPLERRLALLDDLAREFGLAPASIHWTTASRGGAIVRRSEGHDAPPRGAHELRTGRAGS